jgi:hypothetical protein
MIRHFKRPCDFRHLRVPRLIQVAENNRNTEVRKQAMFWLGQWQDPRVVSFCEKVLLKWFSIGMAK